MRGIKFRAWDKKYGKQIQYFGNPSIGSYGFPLEFEHLNEDDEIDGAAEWVFMQFTGLKDKNGVEIYEGDILKWDGYIGEVRWRHSGFENYMHNSTGWHNIHDENEVIGNIYESPELLNDSNA